MTLLPVPSISSGPVRETAVRRLRRERVVEQIRRPVENHPVHLDAATTGVERMSGDLDDRRPLRKIQASGLIWQRHPGTQVLGETGGRMANIGKARIDAAGSSVRVHYGRTSRQLDRQIRGRQLHGSVFHQKAARPEDDGRAGLNAERLSNPVSSRNLAHRHIGRTGSILGVGVLNQLAVTPALPSDPGRRTAPDRSEPPDVGSGAMADDDKPLPTQFRDGTVSSPDRDPVPAGDLADGRESISLGKLSGRDQIPQSGDHPSIGRLLLRWHLASSLDGVRNSHGFSEQLTIRALFNLTNSPNCLEHILTVLNSDGLLVLRDWSTPNAGRATASVSGRPVRANCHQKTGPGGV